jgi:DNA-binding MarR family transcriptional regulator
MENLSRFSSACDKIVRDIYHDGLMRFAMPRPKRAPKPDDALRLGEFLCFAVYSASHAFNRVYKPLLDELGLTYPQYLVMVLLWEQDDQTVGSLGEKLFLESSTLTPLLKRLEALGHVKRTRDPVDERQVRVRLTDKGRAMREKARGIPDCILEASGLEIDELRRLQSELVALRTALERYQRD